MKQVLIFLLISLFIVNVWSQVPNNQTKLILKRNSIYAELAGNGFWYSVNYDRYLPVKDNYGFILRAGLAYYDKLFPMFEANLMSGKNKHHFETGLGYTVFNHGHVVFARMGYRYHGKKGLLLRAAPMYCFTENFPWFGISVGYSF